MLNVSCIFSLQTCMQATTVNLGLVNFTRNRIFHSEMTTHPQTSTEIFILIYQPSWKKFPFYVDWHLTDQIKISVLLTSQCPLKVFFRDKAQSKAQHLSPFQSVKYSAELKQWILKTVFFFLLTSWDKNQIFFLVDHIDLRLNKLFLFLSQEGKKSNLEIFVSFHFATEA